MKYIFLPFFLCLSCSLFAEKIQLCPLPLDENFMHERCLQIECCANNIYNIAQQAPPHIKKAIEYEVLIMEFCLGYEIETDDL